MDPNLSKIVQWNSRSIVNKKSDLSYILNKYDPFAVALCETWLKPGFSFRIPGYACLRTDRSDGYGGVAILIKNNMSFQSFPLPSLSDDISAVAVIVNKICLVCIYYSRPTVNILSEISNLLSVLPKPFLVMGDFNTQHQSWGSSSSNYYGEKLLEILDSNNLCILNTCLPTRQSNPDEGISAPDLSICTPELASTLSWSPLPSSYGSDHYPLIISFPHKKPAACNTTPRLKYRLQNADWDTYKNCVEERILALTNSLQLHDPQLLSNQITRILIEVADNTFPIKNGATGKIPSPPWWDAECTQAIKKRKEAEKNYGHTMTRHNFEIYLDAARTTRKLLRKKKFEGWQRFCASISPEVNASLVWQNIRRFRSAFSDTTASKLPLELANEFMDHLAPPSVPEQRSLMHFPYVPIPNSELNSLFTLSELKGVLSHVKDSAPGEDGITYSFIVNLSDSVLLIYLNLINTALISGNIPSSWKSQTIIPILKSNKPSSNISSYRPIALSTVLAKIAEHLIKNRLEWFLESKNLLATSQFGFRKGKSTMDSLSLFTTDIRLAFSSNNSVIAAFLDISSAYDNVLVSILEQKLNSLQVPTMLSKFIINMLSERSLNLHIEGYTFTRLVWKGLPQGSVLSPILYNIYTYDLESSLNESVQVLQYADDLLLYLSGHSVANICTSLTSSLCLLKTWLETNGLHLSIDKSNIVLFTRMRKPPIVTVRYNNIPMPVKNQVKFLGLILDTHLTGLPHCDYIAAKCERNINIIRCLAGVWWGAHPFSLKLLYNTLIRSVLDYGTFLLEPANVAGLKKLDSVQSKALRVVSGAMKSSPINCLQVECADPPLHLRRQFLADRFMARCFQFTYHPLRNKLSTLSEEVISSTYWSHKATPCLVKSFRKYNLIEAPCHQSEFLPIFHCNYSSLIMSPNIHYNLSIYRDDVCHNLNFNFTMDRDWKGCQLLFTDASKHGRDSCVGVGVYHSQYNIVQKIKLPPESSVFTGECYGLLKAVEYILMMGLRNSLILTDARSALQSLARFPFYSHNPHILFETRELLNRCSIKGYSVHFAWIPSHCGILGNERADQLANDAVLCGDVFPYKNNTQDLAALPKVYLQESWGQLWSGQSVKGKFHRNIQPSIFVKPWFSKYKLSKKITTIIIRMRLGHVCTPAHLARLGIVQNPACECGAEVGDLNHLIFSCPLYDHSSLFQSLVSLRVPLPTSISCILFNFNVDIYKTIALFLVNNDIAI